MSAIHEIPIQVGTDFDAYIDDTDFRTSTPQDAVSGSVLSPRGLHKATAAVLGCSLAIDKIGLVSSSKQIARQIELQLGALAGEPAPSVINSGVDYTAGRALRARGADKGKSSRFEERRALAGRKTLRLCKHKEVLGQKSLRNFTAGPLPSGSYGAEVFGISDTELHLFRSLGMSTIAPKSQRRPLIVISLLEGDPQWRVSIASLVRYAKELWLPQTRQLAGSLSVKLLREAWAQVFGMLATTPLRSVDCVDSMMTRSGIGYGNVQLVLPSVSASFPKILLRWPWTLNLNSMSIPCLCMEHIVTQEMICPSPQRTVQSMWVGMCPRVVASDGGVGAPAPARGSSHLRQLTVFLSVTSAREVGGDKAAARDQSALLQTLQTFSLPPSPQHFKRRPTLKQPYPIDTAVAMRAACAVLAVESLVVTPKAAAEPEPPAAPQPPAAGHRPASRPPAGPGAAAAAASGAAVLLKGGTLPRGLDPLSALASQRQPPEAAAEAEAQKRGGKAGKRDKGEGRTTRSADPTVARRGREPELPQLVRATSLGASGNGSRRLPEPKAPQAMPPARAPAAGWMSPGREQRVDTQELRSRADKVALTHAQEAKEREDSLLRMLDNRTRQRGVL
ncbi:unnamed protein product [Prorocentrum cordatum]|uniref:FACT complex subunit n=1 Tax=Prorocentrum cordatum TaxID=2364126 RepID=A0ABN9VT01_9DINO|nr:unnamed protein product [Polarella glacialis]